MKWFDVLRSQQELLTTNWGLCSIGVNSNVTCIIPRLEIQYPGVWKSNNITMTNP